MISENELIQLIPQAFDSSDLPLAERCSGKVRDWYPLPEGKRLFVTTDRLSVFDRVVANVPYKGQVLNEMAAWWFKQTAEIIENHFVSAPDPNATIARAVEPFLVEVIVRGYITGVTSTALWQRYSLGERDIYGYRFPDGLRKNSSLPTAIITPTTKGIAGSHDERITCAEVVQNGIVDATTWDLIQSAALKVFQRGQEIALKAGLILVDTKYEFGRTPNGEVVLIDEVHTPDSSRFWKADGYEERISAGEEPENFDKEFVRLAYTQSGYHGDGVAPLLPSSVWAAASMRYIALYEMLTGDRFQPGEYPVGPRLLTNLRIANIIQEQES